MSSLWIVHRDSRRRAALARLAGAPEGALLGAPGDPRFETAPPADVVILGLAGDLERELEFAHRAAARLPGAAWILLPERQELARARRLFDALPADLLAYPPEARELRRLLREPRARAPGEPLPLSRRPLRDALADRFARWLGNLEIPELLRALDPRLADLPLLVQGEPGTGRELLARYVHAFAGPAGSEWVSIACTPATDAARVADALAQAARRTRRGASVWLADVERLPAEVQAELCGWLEFAPPAALAGARVARWMAGTCPDADGLEPGLRRALGAITVALPPLRERPDAIAPLANATARIWCTARGEPARRFDETALIALEEYPWPGNLRELEAVVVHSLAASGSDPLRAADLRLDGSAFAPLGAADVDALIASGAPVPSLEESELVADLVPEEIAAAEVLAGEPHEAAPSTPAAAPVPDAALRRLAGAVAHEVRNPLTAIRTFAELLPAHHDDEEFRTRFAELVSRDVLRIEDVVERLGRVAALGPPEPDDVDVTALLEELLELRRAAVRERHLLVLKELDPGRPLARGDPRQLRLAFEALLDGALAAVPERGDVYLASRHHAAGLRGEPSVRVLVRFRGPERAGAPPLAGTSPAENALDFAIAELLVRAQGGALALDTSDAEESVVVLDLPAR